MLSYSFFKWLHLAAIISWMAGLLYLFRLFVYHRNHGQKSSDNHKLLSVMEGKLYKIITVPAMILAWIAGLSMLHQNKALLFSGKWLHWKLMFVVALTLVTFYAGQLIKNFKEQTNKHPGNVYLRIFNEVPTMLMLVILALVIFRPF